MNTILGVASSPNYYFTRRSYTRWYECRVAVGPYSRILFYRDIIVESECHGVTRHSRECLVRLVSFRGECRLLDISSLDECYSAQVKSIESRRAFNEGERERERNCFFEKKTRM